MRIARASPERYEDLSLESVANAVLGEGKDVKRRGEEKLAALDELYGRDPVAFSAYCLKDSRLALDILRATGLDELTLRRASLAGVPLDRAWTSVPAFEAVYAAGLKRRGMLPPARRPGRVGSAPGGMILEPAPGFFHDVIVLDFKSLYPTIMLTFNIDPLAYSRAKADPALGAVAAPNGARFSRELGILPEAIDGYLSARDEAKSRGDAIASYVYKILMNSFYGVLASDACRYSDEAIAGAITSFGHKYLSRARDLLVERGARVLYGDTDSVFLVPAAFSDAPPKASGPDAGRAEALEREGRSLVASLNEAFAVEVSREYGVRSRLEIKLEKAYDRFLLPSVRGVRASERRGRAKGYAGRLAATGEVEIKGMEAARSDWTPFAKRFQLELLERAFRGDGPSELRAFVASEEMRLESGALDAELVFRRSLRRAPDDYVKVEPPHVRAARLAGLTDARGVIEYVLTTDGAQPVGAVVSPIDRARYIESQLLPIALSVEDAMGVRFVPEGRGAQGSFDF
jgi:DNA polymerase-2